MTIQELEYNLNNSLENLNLKIADLIEHHKVVINDILNAYNKEKSKEDSKEDDETINKIIKLICEFYAVDKLDVVSLNKKLYTSKKRNYDSVLKVRDICLYLLAKYYNYKSGKLTKYFNLTDPAIRNSNIKMQRYLQYDSALVIEVTDVKRKLNKELK